MPQGSSTSFHYRIDRHDDHALLVVIGDLKFKDPARFVEKYQAIHAELAADGVELVGVDLTRAETITSSTLAILYQLAKQHPAFYVCVVQPHILKQMRTIRLDDCVRIASGWEEVARELAG